LSNRRGFATAQRAPAPTSYLAFEKNLKGGLL
jgi:hypothetical protein